MSAAIIISFFVLLLISRIRTRALYARAQKCCQQISLSASQYFKTQSSELKASDWSVYRWVCTNWGYKSPFRYLRAVFSMQRTNSPIFYIMNYFAPQQDRVQLQLKLKLPFEGYACIVSEKHVPAFTKARRELLQYCTQGKPLAGRQTAESFQGLAQLLQIEGKFHQISLENNELEMVVDAKHLTEMTTQLFKVAQELLNFRLNDAQEKQNNKRIEASLKQTLKQNQAKQVEEDEEKVQQKMDELAQQIEKETDQAEKQKMQLKLEGMKKRQQMKMQKQMANQMGMGGMMQQAKKQKMMK